MAQVQWTELGNGIRLQSGGWSAEVGVGGIFYACILRSRVSAAGDQFRASLRSIGVVVVGSPPFTTAMLPNGTYETRFLFRVGSETDVLNVKRWITTAAFYSGPYEIYILGDGGGNGYSAAQQFTTALTPSTTPGDNDGPGFLETLNTLAKTPLYLAIFGAVVIVGYLLWKHGA